MHSNLGAIDLSYDKKVNKHLRIGAICHFYFSVYVKGQWNSSCHDGAGVKKGHDHDKKQKPAEILDAPDVLSVALNADNFYHHIRNPACQGGA